MTPTRTIATCIHRCSKYRNGRGPWQAERACAAALGGSAIDRQAAAAARRLGVWLREWGAAHVGNTTGG